MKENISDGQDIIRVLQPFCSNRTDAITNYNSDILFNEQLVGSYVEDSARNGVCVYDKDEEVRSAAL